MNFPLITQNSVSTQLSIINKANWTSGHFAVRISESVWNPLALCDQWEPWWRCRPRRTLGVVVRAAPAARSRRAARRRAGLQSSGSRTEAARVDSGWYWAKYGGTKTVRLRVFQELRRFSRSWHLRVCSPNRGSCPTSRSERSFRRNPRRITNWRVSPWKTGQFIDCGQLFPMLERFWCSGDNWLRLCSDVPGARPRAMIQLPFIPCGYPAGMKLCNIWVLSCQHQLQILACREADRSEFGEMLLSFTGVCGWFICFWSRGVGLFLGLNLGNV